MKTICHDNSLTIVINGVKKTYATLKEYRLAKLNALIKIDGVFFPYSRYTLLCKDQALAKG